jgi:hypothetical protein
MNARLEKLLEGRGAKSKPTIKQQKALTTEIASGQQSKLPKLGLVEGLEVTVRQGHTQG